MANNDLKLIQEQSGSLVEVLFGDVESEVSDVLNLDLKADHIELGVLDPSVSGAVASISTIGTSIDNTQWVKVGELDTDWRQFLTGEEDGTFSANIELADVSEVILPLNTLGVKNGEATLGDGNTVGGVPIGGSTIPHTFVGTATNTVMLNGDIPASAYQDDTTIVQLQLGSSVTSIGDDAFNSSITIEGAGDLTIPDSVISIGPWGFFGCTGFNGTLTLPNNPAFTTIEPSTFRNCGRFENGLTIPNNVEIIGESAFRLSNFHGDIIIGDSVTSVGDWAFGSANLNSSHTISFGNSVTSIGDSALVGAYFGRIEIHALAAPTIGSGAFDYVTISPPEIHVPVGATGYAASYAGLTVVYDL